MPDRRVKVGKTYEFQPVLFDRMSPPAGCEVAEGQRVKVVNQYGCPKANTMGMCYIETMEGEFAGMVCTNSLVG